MSQATTATSRRVFRDRREAGRVLGVTPEQMREIAEREGRELIRREEAYRRGRSPVEVTGKTVLLVDDGLATGPSMQAAVQAAGRSVRRDDPPRHHTRAGAAGGHQRLGRR